MMPVPPLRLWSLSRKLAPLAVGAALVLTTRPSGVGGQLRADGPWTFDVADQAWHDEGRDRTVPVRLYLPRRAEPSPVVLLSHGLGGTRAAMAYLAERWASHGFVVVALQHPGSDDGVWTGRPAREHADALNEAATFENLLLRTGDVSFVLDHLAEERAEGASWTGGVDVERVGVAGHSFGARTALAVAGGRIPLRPRQTGAVARRALERMLNQVGGGRFDGDAISFLDERVDAATALSPADRRDRDPEAAWGAVTVPVLHMTGTDDFIPIGPGTPPEDRTLPFRRISGVPQVLVVFQGGDHMVFSGRERPDGPEPTDERYRDHILAVTTAFWKAVLAGDTDAEAWLFQGGAAAELQGDARVEVKRGGPPP